MKVVISPAKSLDYTTKLPVTDFSKPQFIKESKQINLVLKKLSSNELKDLMRISDKLANLNWERNQNRNFNAAELNDSTRQAVFAFNGDVYNGLNAYTLTETQTAYLQEHLRILSGLYGYLRPLDVIEPYRLEMGTKLPIADADNLYAFWKSTLTSALNKELKTGDYLINLASNEYFNVLDKKELKAKIITPEFKDYKENKLKTISFFAKKARGMMVRFMAEHNLKDPEELKLFNAEGYQFDQGLSTATKWVFTR